MRATDFKQHKKTELDKAPESPSWTRTISNEMQALELFEKIKAIFTSNTTRTKLMLWLLKILVSFHLLLLFFSFFCPFFTTWRMHLFETINFSMLAFSIAQLMKLSKHKSYYGDFICQPFVRIIWNYFWTC